MATQTFPATGTDRATESAAPRQRYRLVLAALIAMIVLSPFLDQREDSWLLTLLSASVLITVIVSVRGRRYPFWFAVAVAVANLSANLLTLLTKAPWPMLADGVLGLTFYAFTTWVIFSDVMRARQVSADTLCGAVCVYLLLGATFGLLFYTLELLAPGSFGVTDAADSAGAWSQLHYFSFVTLTTVGYGDLSPLSDHARSLAIIEGVTGQLYLAVLVARLVGKFHDG